MTVSSTSIDSDSLALQVSWYDCTSDIEHFAVKAPWANAATIAKDPEVFNLVLSKN